MTVESLQSAESGTAFEGAVRPGGKIINRGVWHVYILRCADGTLYTGITTDMRRRLNEHNRGRRGAAYTRSRRPVDLVFCRACTNRAAALRQENAIKKLPRLGKLDLISDHHTPGSS